MRLKFFCLILILSVCLISPAAVLAATLSLSPSTGTFNKNCPFSLDIILDTEGAQTDGTDAILIYDNSRLTVNSITAGAIYSDNPGSNIDDVTGKITVSGLASVSQAFSGKGTLAKVNLTVKDSAPTGATQIKFDFDANDKTKTSDSNVVEKGTVVDVLSQVTNGNYTIGSGTACTSSSPAILPNTGGGNQGAVSTPSATEVPFKILPPAGTEKFTFTLAIVGSVLSVLGILGLALL